MIFCVKKSQPTPWKQIGKCQLSLELHEMQGTTFLTWQRLQRLMSIMRLKALILKYTSNKKDVQHLKWISHLFPCQFLPYRLKGFLTIKKALSSQGVNVRVCTQMSRKTSSSLLLYILTTKFYEIFKAENIFLHKCLLKNVFWTCLN